MITGQGQSADQLTAAGRIKVLDDIIRSKAATGRANDEEDVLILRALKRNAK
jgi:hypothetical protein